MKRAEDRASAAIEHQLIARRGNGFGSSTALGTFVCELELAFRTRLGVKHTQRSNSAAYAAREARRADFPIGGSQTALRGESTHLIKSRLVTRPDQCPYTRTLFHHQPEAQHPKSSAIHKLPADYPIFRGDCVAKVENYRVMIFWL
jgi:hypothetical protein